MALSATITPVTDVTGGTLFSLGGAGYLLVADVELSGTITATTGDTLDFSDFFSQLGVGEQYMVLLPSYVNGYGVTYDHSTKRIKFFQGDNDGTSDGPGVQLGAVTIPSALENLRVVVLGH
jgi:hypothetical protein